MTIRLVGGRFEIPLVCCQEASPPAEADEAANKADAQDFSHFHSSSFLDWVVCQCLNLSFCLALPMTGWNTFLKIVLDWSTSRLLGQARQWYTKKNASKATDCLPDMIKEIPGAPAASTWERRVVPEVATETEKSTQPRRRNRHSG